MKLSGQTVLVTGGNGGIGLALAKAFLTRKNRVVICGRNTGKLAEAQKLLPGSEAHACDVGDPAQLEAFVAMVKERYPDLSILVNNAAIMNVADLRRGGAVLGQLEAEVNINFLAPLRLSLLLLPLLERRESAIVNVSSGVAYAPMGATPVYSATKAALHSFSKSLRHQLRETSIEVFEVLPPLVDTEMPAKLEGTGKSRERMSPEDVAREVLEGMEAGKTEIAIGDARLLSFASRFFPGFVEKRLNEL